MKTLKSIVLVLSIVMLLSSVQGIFINEVEAAPYLVEKVDLYSKGEMVSFRYKETYVAVNFVVYKVDGIEYPAYCLNKDLIGVTEQHGTSATVKKAYQNEEVRRVILNGYPFKTPFELDCKTEHEAYAATKMAIDTVLYDYNLADFEFDNEQGKRVLDAMEQILEEARVSKEIFTGGEMKIMPVNEMWQIDSLQEEYMSKSYEVITNAENMEYIVNLEGIDTDSIKIVNKNNEESTKFGIGEKFKVLIPISEIEKSSRNIEFELSVTANLQTKPILYGETPYSTYQNYALVSGESEYKEETIEEIYVVNHEGNEKQDEVDKEDDTRNGSDKKVNDKTEKNLKNNKRRIKGKSLPRTGF